MWRGGFAWTILILTLVTLLTNQVETRFVARQDSGTATSSSSTSATPSTSASSSPSATPILVFDNDFVLQPFTCQPVDIYWSYSGPRANINLYVTNIGVSQSVPPPRLSSISEVRAAASPSQATDTTNLRNVTLATNINPYALSFSWSSVNIPQGWYVINATMPAQSYDTGSIPFYVHTGNNTSCISSGSTSKSSTASSFRTSSSPVGTSYQSNVAMGVAVGTSLGAIGIIVAIVIGCVWLQRRKNKKSCRRHPRSYIHSPHWKGIGSADSQGALRGDNLKTCHVPHNDSIGTAFHLTQSEETAGAEKSSIHSKIDSVSCEQDVTLSSLPVLKQQSSRIRPFAIDRSNSLSSSTTHGLSNDHSTTPERRPSRRNAVSARRSFDSIAYPPTASVAHLSTTSHDDSPSPVTSPHAPPKSYVPPDASKLAHRQSLGRKRKPVPAYDAEELASPPPAPPVPASTSPVSPSTSPFDALPASSRPTSSNAGHYVIRNQSSQEFGRPELSHKGSFGPGKPVHYLIPDMPLPQQK